MKKIKKNSTKKISNREKRIKKSYPLEKKGELVKDIFFKSEVYLFWPLVWFALGFIMVAGVIIAMGFGEYFTATLLFWLIVLGGYLLYNWALMAGSYAILTNQRIINIEQLGLFAKRIDELELKKIDRIAYRKNGALAKMLDSGNVYLFYKNTNQFMSLDIIKDPESVASLISRAR